jgi:hypothetical protein
MTVDGRRMTDSKLTTADERRTTVAMTENQPKQMKTGPTDDRRQTTAGRGLREQTTTADH